MRASAIECCLPIELPHVHVDVHSITTAEPSLSAIPAASAINDALRVVCTARRRW